MSEQNKNTSAVDWAEKLKASMENTSAEPETTASPAEVEDDLAALLRAQLGLSRESSTYADELDTSEFEEEYEEEPEEDVGLRDVLRLSRDLDRAFQEA